MSQKSESFLSFLNSEIQRIEVERTKPGWTRWALIGSLATSLWFLINEIEKFTFKWHQFTLLILISFFIIHLYQYFDSILQDPNAKSIKPKFRAIGINGYQLRKNAIISVILHCIMIILVYDLCEPSFPFFKILCLTIFTIKMVVYILVFFLSYSPFPIPTNVYPKNRFYIIGILSIIHLYLLSSLIISTLNSQFPIAPPDIRIAGLITSIFILSTMLLDSLNRNYILESLYDIRRGLALDQINYDEAKSQIDIVLSGFNASEIIQGRVNNYIFLTNQTENYLKQASDKLHMIVKIRKTKINDKFIQSISELLDSSIENFNQAFELQLKRENILDSIDIRMRLLIKIFPSVNEEISNLRTKISISTKKIRAELDQFKLLMDNTSGKVSKLTAKFKSER